MSRPSDGLYAEVIHVPCPECGVGVDEFCRNSRFETGTRARVPCHRRITAAETAGQVERQRPVLPADSAAPATEGREP